MKTRTPHYWEYVRDEIAAVFEEHGPIAQLPNEPEQTKTWEEARKEAIERLYVIGIYAEIPF